MWGGVTARCNGLHPFLDGERLLPGPVHSIFMGGERRASQRGLLSMTGVRRAVACHALGVALTLSACTGKIDQGGGLPGLEDDTGAAGKGGSPAGSGGTGGAVSAPVPI